MGKNVMIPLEIMEKLICLLEYMESPIDSDARADRFQALCCLREKKRRLDLRDDYAQIVFAENEGDRDMARIRYLQQKGW